MTQGGRRDTFSEHLVGHFRSSVGGNVPFWVFVALFFGRPAPRDVWPIC